MGDQDAGHSLAGLRRRIKIGRDPESRSRAIDKILDDVAVTFDRFCNVDFQIFRWIGKSPQCCPQPFQSIVPQLLPIVARLDRPPARKVTLIRKVATCSQISPCLVFEPFAKFARQDIG